MGKKVIVNESTMKQLLLKEAVAKVDIDAIINSKEFDKKIKSLIKSDKDFEKEVRKIIAQSLVDVFKALWQRNNFWKNLV